MQGRERREFANSQSKERMQAKSQSWDRAWGIRGALPVMSGLTREVEEFEWFKRDYGEKTWWRLGTRAWGERREVICDVICTLARGDGYTPLLFPEGRRVGLSQPQCKGSVQGDSTQSTLTWIWNRCRQNDTVEFLSFLHTF